MGLKENLYAECIQIGSKARNKKEVLGEIAHLAIKSPVLSAFSADDIFGALEARENICSTGFENGVAIPHCGIDKLDDFVVGVLIIPEGIDFQAMDGKKTRVYFFVIGPKTEKNRHIHLLSSISRIMKSPGIINELIGAKEKDIVQKRLLEQEGFRKEVKEVKGRCLFLVVVQKEELFEEILQVFTAVEPCSVAVLEGNNAGYYLHAMPLFSALWLNTDRTYNRVIIAVVNKELSNDVIRRINMVAEDIESSSGLLITVQDLVYSSGAVEF
ncbi:MAG TPA: PTS sugar transporter subunit IIA [Spirochaetes bacterium]|nr:PTS sugar transporter subunit IIA [Spirochaetota bacterium]